MPLLTNRFNKVAVFLAVALSIMKMQLALLRENLCEPRACTDSVRVSVPRL